MLVPVAALFTESNQMRTCPVVDGVPVAVDPVVVPVEVDAIGGMTPDGARYASNMYVRVVVPLDEAVSVCACAYVANPAIIASASTSVSPRYPS